MKITALAICAAILTSSWSMAQNAVTANILHRVFAARNGDVQATAFAIDVSNRQYLVTAKHLVPGTNTEATVSVFHESQWKPLPVRVMRSPDSDIAVVCPPFQLAPDLPVSLSGESFLGEDVFFLGFPYFLHTDLPGSNGGFPIAFVKKGALSAWFKGSGRYATIYIDGHNNQGFSGGPLVVVNQKREVVILGVVSGYRTNPDPVVNRELNTGMVSMGNAGIVVCYDIHYALDEIVKEPTGAPIKQE